MDISELINNIIAFLKDNPILAIVIGIALLFAGYRKPKLFFGVLFIILLLAGVIYLVLSMSSGGVSQKKKLLEKGLIPESSISRPLRFLPYDK